MSDPAKPEMTPITPAEKSRVYRFPGGETVALTDVTHFLARPSGTHRLRTGDGKLHIVTSGWLHIVIETDDWTF